MGGEENEVIIVKKNQQIKLERQSKKGIAKLICKEIVDDLSV